MDRNADFMQRFLQMEPMYYYERNPNELSANLRKKYDAMVENKNNEYIATVKHDGEWAMLIKGATNDDIHIKSRSISKVTGTYGDKTSRLPHIVEQMKTFPPYTVALAEICWLNSGTVSTDVGTIMRCKPEEAVRRQEAGGWLSAVIFDVLAYVSCDFILEGKGYWDRLCFAPLLADGCSAYVWVTECFTGGYPLSFRKIADNIIENGGEGLMIQRRDYVYEPGKRAAWKTMKLKAKTSQMEVKVIGTIHANKEYSGKSPNAWTYWEEHGKGTLYEGRRINPDDIPISEPYYKGWKKGIVCDLNGEPINVSSGLTHAQSEWLATDMATERIREGRLWATVQGMQVTAEGKLRQPVVKKLTVKGGT